MKCRKSFNFAILKQALHAKWALFVNETLVLAILLAGLKECSGRAVVVTLSLISGSVSAFGSDVRIKPA